MTALLVALASIWGGVWWRLRGGAFTTLTGIDPGTGGMRAIAAFAMMAPFASAGWHWLALIPLAWLAWSLAGWGAFQSMGASPIETKNPVASILARVGVTSRLWNDLLGMAIEGAYCTIVILSVGEFIKGDGWAQNLASVSGVMFAPLYFVAQHSPYRPNFGGFARAGSEWGEVLVGAFVGGVIAFCVFV